MKIKTTFESFQIGDKVTVNDTAVQRLLDKAEEKQAYVYNPNGPNDTVGVMIDGKYHLVDLDEISLVLESIGLTEWAMSDTTSGVSIPVFGEDMEILKKIKETPRKSDMDEREQEIARKLVTRGVLNRKKDNEGIYFELNNIDLVRD